MKSKEQRLIKVEAPFIDESLELAIIKVLDKNTQSMMILKLKFMQNSATLDITNSGLDTIIFDPKEMLGILDLRSIGYYKIKQGILEQDVSKYYRFKSAGTLCEQFNKFINTLKKERQEETKGKYPWLDPSDERKYMTDGEILEKYIYLEKSCLTDKEKKEVMDMLYEYKEAFSLRDEIDTCPYIEEETDIRINHNSSLDISCKRRQKFYRQRNEAFMICRCIKGRIFAYSSPLMLITIKVM